MPGRVLYEPNISSLLLLLLFVGQGLGVRILSLQVLPEEPLEIGKDDSAVLDCDFEVTTEEEKAQLDIKWYFNRSHASFVQWIPSTGRKPQFISSSGFDLNHLDLEYTLADDGWVSRLFWSTTINLSQTILKGPKPRHKET